MQKGKYTHLVTPLRGERVRPRYLDPLFRNLGDLDLCTRGNSTQAAAKGLIRMPQKAKLCAYGVPESGGASV